MSLKFIDGFDHYDGADATAKWDIVPNAVDSVAGLNGNAVQLDAGEVIHKLFVPASTTCIVGFSCQQTTFGTDDGIIRFADSSNLIHLTLEYTSTDNDFIVYRGTETGTIIARTTTGDYDLQDTWHYIEWKVFIDDTIGSFELRWDGTSILSASGVDTRDSIADGKISRVTLKSGVKFTLFDNFYIDDGTEFLGPKRVTTVYPTSDGAYQDFTPLNGGSNFAEVDEALFDTTTYVESSTVSDKDAYRYPVSALLDEVNAVQINVIATKTDANPGLIRNVARIQSTDYFSASQTLTQSTYLDFTNVWETNPNSGIAWTTQDIALTDFGVEVFTGTTSTVRATQVVLEILQPLTGTIPDPPSTSGCDNTVNIRKMWPPVINEQFTHRGGPGLPGSDTLPENWTIASGDFTTNSEVALDVLVPGELSYSGTLANDISSRHVTNSNYVVVARTFGTEDMKFEVRGRRTGAGDYISFRVDFEFNTVELRQALGSAVTTLESSTHTFEFDDVKYYSIELWMLDEDIRGFVNGAQVICATSFEHLTVDGYSLFVPEVFLDDPPRFSKFAIHDLIEFPAQSLEGDNSNLILRYRKLMKATIENPDTKDWASYLKAYKAWTIHKNLGGHRHESWDDLGYDIRNPFTEDFLVD